MEFYWYLVPILLAYLYLLEKEIRKEICENFPQFWTDRDVIVISKAPIWKDDYDHNRGKLDLYGKIGRVDYRSESRKKLYVNFKDISCYVPYSSVKLYKEGGENVPKEKRSTRFMPRIFKFLIWLAIIVLVWKIVLNIQPITLFLIGYLPK